ncbi:glycosyltransferase [Pacificimonas sp. WHA3]|uniref:Glycosyltransferase n=1 Tax=Pacificimonas pallii TaxID=2827236 RepID=A0ABS6SEE4_9SPHN|nr:glycosyltransferase [Pacificimonas pallii]MBV7256759.1 glycosyltransferase [Pacificimonas pallii]
MRIVTAIYGQGRGGSERAAMRLVRGWRAAGHDVDCIGERGDGKARPYALAARIARACGAAPTDVLFAPGQTYAVPFALSRVRTGNAPPLVTKISNMPEAGLRGAAGRFWLGQQRRWTNVFVAPDEMSRNALARAMPALAPRLIAIANPAADEPHLRALRKIRGPDADGLNLLAIGRLVRQKNFALLIRAFAQIMQPGDRLTILGDGPEKARLSALARRLSVDIDLPGHQIDVTPWIARATAFASSSEFEGLPAVLVEAMAAGLPIAATDSSPAIGTLLRNGELGILVSDGSVPAFASALTRLRDFTPNQEKMYDAACTFTGERAAPAYLALFESLANSAGHANANR